MKLGGVFGVCGGWPFTWNSQWFHVRRLLPAAPTRRGGLVPLLLLAFYPGSLFSQARATTPDILWQKCLGGSHDDFAYSIIQTTDGGYAMCGYTTSMDGDVVHHHAGYGEDAWVVKMTPSGEIEWQKCLGGTWNEEANSIAQTADGGYVVAVRTESNDGDVSGNHGDGDAWIVKLSDVGKIEWSKCYGGSNSDDPSSILVTPAGDYVYAGFIRSVDGPEVSGKHGPGDDVWVVKINTSGTRVGWQKCFGGSERDVASSIVMTADGGYAVAGYTNSKDGDLRGYAGTDTFYDAWLVKLNAAGNIQWQKRYGGMADDWANTAIQTADGGYAVAGVTYSNDRDVSGDHGNGDAWIFKTDDTGAIEWQTCVGGMGYDAVRSIVETPDGGIIAVGFTGSTDGDIKLNHGSPDILLVKISPFGEMEWQKCLGGTGIERAYSIIRTNDDGYVVAGYASSTDGDVSGGHGGYDAWIVKLGTKVDAVTASETQNTGGRKDFALRASASARVVSAGFEIPRSSSQVTIEIANIEGARLQGVSRTDLAAGPHEESIDVSALAAGTYFITVHADGLSQTVPFQIVR